MGARPGHQGSRCRPSPEAGARAGPEAEELSLAERAYRTIRDRLVMLEICPGAPINEEQLAQRSASAGHRCARRSSACSTSASSPPVLAAAPSLRTSTSPASSTSPRCAKELLAAARAARRATATDRATLTALQRGLESTDPGWHDAAVLMRLDLQVHRAVYAATHNPYLEDTLVRHDNLATRIWCLFVDRLSDMAGHVDEHGPLIEAIVAGDPDKAAQLARAHVEGFERAIRDAM